MNEQKKFGAITSSYDPQEISVTILALTKVIAGSAVFFGVLTTTDSTTLLNQVPALITDVLALAPLGYAAWNSAEVIFGLLRKALVAVFQNKNVATPYLYSAKEVPTL